MHDAFDVYRLLEHRGDWKEVVKAAAAELGMKAKKRAAQHSTPRGGAPTATDAVRPDGSYVLTPGAHLTDMGEYIERGTSELPRKSSIGSRTARYTGVAEYPARSSAPPERKAFKVLEIDEARLLADGCMRLGKWVGKRVGEETQQVQVFAYCSKDHGGIIVAKARTDPRIPAVEVITPYPIYVPGLKQIEERLARRGMDRWD